MVKFGVITDLHNGIADDQPATKIWSLEKRWYTNAPTRMTNFATAMTSLGDVDFCIDLGDIVDSQATSELTELTEITNVLEASWTGDMHYCIGNHEHWHWRLDWTDYESEISQSPPGGGNFWTTGKPAGYPNTTAYSFDKKGVHFIVMTALSSFDTSQGNALVTWLTADIAATDLPIVVFSHYHLDDSSGNAQAYYDRFAAIQTVLEGGNVQAVITSHQHPIPRLCDFIYTKDEIPYYHLRGNCLGPMDGSEPDVSAGKDAAFYVFEIMPNAVKGTGRMLANIKATCYYTAREAANQVDSMDREYIKYAVI